MVRAAAIGTAAALVAVAVTFFIGDAVSGPLVVTPFGADEPEEVVIGFALFFTLLGGVVGLGIAALCKRFLDNPAVAFLGICVVGLILYGIAPFSAGEDVATGIWLNVMHIAAAIPIVGSLYKELQGSPI